MLPLVLGQSQLWKGDWIVVPDNQIAGQAFRVDPEHLELVDRFAIDERLPLTTKRTFYGVMTPVDRFVGPRFAVTLFRVTNPFVPKPPIALSGGERGYAGTAR